MNREAHERYLLELSSLPTASGREDRVAHWVRDWVKAHPKVELMPDRFGNLLLSHKRAKGDPRKPPIVFGAHMDHPCFVVTEWRDAVTLEAEFRGGVADRFFREGQVRLWRAGAKEGGAVGRVREMHQPAAEDAADSGGHKDKWGVIVFDERVEAEPGDLLPWALKPASIREGVVRAPALDDLAGVAAALAAFEMLLEGMPEDAAPTHDVRVLLTRAEEVGFVGAMAACKSGLLPPEARIVALEASKSFADSPLGAGPIVRVGDRTSTFDPDLTYRVGRVAEAIAAEDAGSGASGGGGFKFQRKLMPGGTCEASAYQALGFTATCLCLALLNYHNMDEAAPGGGRIAREAIALEDYHGLIRLLVAIGEGLDVPAKAPPLKTRLDQIYAGRIELLTGGDEA